MNVSQWTCTYILLPLTGIRSLHKTQGEAQTWPQAVSHHSVSSPSTRISFYEAFRNTNCRKTNNCNNCCPRSDLKRQSKMVSQNSHTTAFIFGKKKIILLRRLRGAPVLESRHIHGIYISKTTPITSFQRRAHESLPRQSIRTALV